MRDAGVVDCRGEDFVGGQVEALEVEAVGVDLGEADEEACEGGEAEFGEEATSEADLLGDGAEEAEVDLAPPGCAAHFDGASKGVGFLW